MNERACACALAKQKVLEVHVCFVDLEKGSDCDPRGVLWGGGGASRVWGVLVIIIIIIGHFSPHRHTHTHDSPT